MKNTYTAFLLVFIMGFEALFQIDATPWFFSSSSDSKGGGNPDAPCHLKVNITEWRPFQYFNKDGQAEGLQVDLVSEVLESAGCKATFQKRRFFKTIEELKSGEVDIAINATITEDRKEFANFSVPYRNEILVLYATAPFINRCQKDSLAVLINDGLRLGLQKESVYGKSVDNILKQQGLSQKIHYLDKISDNYKLVMNNEIDGVIDEPIPAAYHIRKNHLEKKLESCQVPVYSNPVSFMFSKKSVSPEVIERINQAIIKIKQTDNYKKTWRWQ